MMRLAQSLVAEKWTVSGIGYDPEGQIFCDDRPVKDVKKGSLGRCAAGVCFV